jgi:hypothetical protein
MIKAKINQNKKEKHKNVIHNVKIFFSDINHKNKENNRIKNQFL